MATTKVTRLDQYPAEDPTGWAVGFTVTTDNNRSFYRDTVISFIEATSDNLAIDLAYGRLRQKLYSLTASYEKQGSRLGSEYIDRGTPIVDTTPKQVETTIPAEQLATDDPSTLE